MDNIQLISFKKAMLGIITLKKNFPMSVSYLIYWIFYVNELLESVQARLAQSVARQFRDPEFPVQTLPGANKFDKCSELTGLLPSHLSLAYISMREHQKIEALKDLMYHI